MIREYDFETARERDRTFNIYDKLDDVHANGVHDYLKYLKFGYGRATDDASTEIRHGRITREEGIDFVMKHDPKRPRDLDLLLEFLDITEEDFEGLVEHLRDERIWGKDAASGKVETQGPHRQPQERSRRRCGPAAGARGRRLHRQLEKRAARPAHHGRWRL